MDINELAQLAELHQLQHQRSLLDLLDHLRQIDPEIAKRAIHVFDDKTVAAGWLANPVQPWAVVRPSRCWPRAGAGTC